MSEGPSPKSLQIIHAGESVEKREPSYTIDKNASGAVALENSTDVPQKAKNRTAI